MTRINYTLFPTGQATSRFPVDEDPGLVLTRTTPARYCSDQFQVRAEGSTGISLTRRKIWRHRSGAKSFAKELVEHRIKVNAICPGNYAGAWAALERPGERTFVQYLNTGKVPGATSIQEACDFYVDKVPMRRGCSPVDVTRAILYCVEQQYETGQAIPVTGGQNMLKRMVI